MEESPLGSAHDDGIAPDRPPRELFSLKALLIISAMVVVLFLILVPNFLRARARGQLTACKSNLKNLATALEMYASDNKGRYPDRLDRLIPGKYLRQIPTCPSHSAWSLKPTTEHDYTYEMSVRANAFSMCCRGDHASAYQGFQADPRLYPRYDSVQGLIDHP